MTTAVGERRAPIPFALASARSPLKPPDGRPLIVHVVVNVETWPFAAEMPRTLLPAPHGLRAVPDVPNFSWVEYGLRCGMPRLLESLAGLAVSASLNARIAERYPELLDAILAAGWEPVAHGLEQRSLLAVPDERAEILQTLDLLERSTGRRPSGWLGPGLHESFATPGLLAELGIRYVLDWALDDLPAWIETLNGRLLALPYSLELNDSLLFAVQQQTAEEYERRVASTLAAFESELGRQVRVLTLPLHPHLIAVPHRIGHLRRVLAMLRARDDTVFLAAGDLAAWFRASDAEGVTSRPARRSPSSAGPAA